MAGRLRLVRMPGYCPELNPDELLNQDVKTDAVEKSRPRDRAELMRTVCQHLHHRQLRCHTPQPDSDLSQ